VNIKDIAKLAGVSKATVSRVLNKSDSVAEDTKKKVLSVIEEVGFLPNYLARSLKIKKTKTIGVIVPDIGNPFYFEIIRGIEKFLDKNGFNIMLCNSDYIEKKELRYISLLASKKVDGIILATSSEDSKSLKKLQLWDIPYVIFDLPQNNHVASSVFIDHSLCSYIAANHLIENGHEKILIIDTYRNMKAYSKYVTGYIKALKENNIEIDKDLIQETTPDINGGYQIIKKLIQSNTKFTAVLAISDLIAVGVYRIAQKYNIKIPEDLSVIGNDDIPLARYLSPPLTTIQQPTFLIGYKSAELLINNIHSKSTDGNDCETIMLNIRLIIRESVKRRKNGKD
jgi:LacI family transcriptional regulator